MTILRVCTVCGGEYHAYENGDGTAYGRCYNCGATFYLRPTSSFTEEELEILRGGRPSRKVGEDDEDAALLENHLRGSRRGRA